MLGEVTLRPAKKNEALEIAKLHVAVWRETYKSLAPQQAYNKLDAKFRLPTWEASLKDTKQAVWVAEVSGHLVGLVCVGPPSNPVFASYGEIKHLYVAQNARQSGLGARLLTQGFKALLARGFSAAALAVLSKNPRAIKFYQAHGGQETTQFFDQGPLWRSENTLMVWEDIGHIT